MEGPTRIREPDASTQTLADHSLGVFVYEEPVAPKQVVDGLSKTAGVAETVVRRQTETEWVNGQNIFAQDESTPINVRRDAGNEIGSPHPGGASVVFCDAHVEFRRRLDRTGRAERDVDQGRRRVMTWPRRVTKMTQKIGLVDSKDPIIRARHIICLFVSSCAFSWPSFLPAEPFTFDDIQFWVGSGANRAALVIDWVERSPNSPSLAWGYRWDGTARGSDMLRAIVAADNRLFAKFGGPPSNPNAVYGIGYDADGDGQFALDDGTTFDDSGIAFTSPADLATSTDADDYYAEGWFTGFWHYGVEIPAGTNPYDGSNWSDIPVGMASRTLIDGSWDSWTFSPTFNFAAFAENPQPAAPPFSPGDFNRDGQVDAADYSLWRSAFGSTSQLEADGNADGIVDAADYVVWRNHFTTASAASAAAGTGAVPEPCNARSDQHCAVSNSTLDSKGEDLMTDITRCLVAVLQFAVHNSS